VFGIKHQIVVDTRGLSHAVTVTTANVTDRQGAIEMIGQNKDNFSDVKKLTGEPFASAIKEGRR
jgi:hypothetical protein